MPVAHIANAPTVLIVPATSPMKAVPGLIGGRVEMMFDTSTSALPHVKGG